MTTTSSSSNLSNVREYLAPGLYYSEEVKTESSRQVRYCYLWLEGEAAAVSELEVHSFQQRFGAVVIPAEGIGGVETRPQFRQRGYVARLLRRATASMAQRVDVAFVGDAIEGMYEKFGYRNCLAEGHLALNVRHIERVIEQNPLPLDNRIVRTYTPADLPAMVDLYNATHVRRPWTHVRQSDWNRLVPVRTWAPGSTALVLAEGEQVVGYAIYKDHFYGWSEQKLVIDEFAALDRSAAQRLLLELAQRCWHFRLSNFTVHEPVDSLVGFVARQFGCESVQTFPTTGGMMGAILHREALVEALEPELRRRLPNAEFLAEHTVNFPALRQGELITDDETLLRLLLGYWSMADAQAAGVTIPPDRMPLCAAWFPGGGTRTLPLPYAHKLDRY